MPTPAPAMPPLPQDVEQFLTWMTDQKGFSPATISAYRTDLLQFEGWLHREQHSLARPGELEKYHFQDYSAHLFHEGQARSSIGRKLSALRSLFRYLMKMKKIDKNPAKLVRNPKRELRHPTALNVDQMFTLLDEASVESGGAAGLDGSRQASRRLRTASTPGTPAIWRWRNCSTVPGCVFPKLSIWMWTMWTRQAVSSGSWARVPRNASRH